MMRISFGVSAGVAAPAMPFAMERVAEIAKRVFFIGALLGSRELCQRKPN